MREQNRDKDRLKHILDTICTIEDSVVKFPKEELLNQPLFFYGLVKQIEIIGEAANKLTQEFRNAHNDIEWRPIISMRNVLVHDYIHISKDLLWDTIENNIPELKIYIERYYKELTN